MVGSASGFDNLFAHLLAILASDDLHLAWLVSYSPHHVILGALVVGIAHIDGLAILRLLSLWYIVLLFTNALALTINEEFHLVGMVVIAPHIYLLTRNPVPVREEMEHILVSPLALVHIVTILWQTSEVDDTEVAATCRIRIRSRLADIVEARPDKLSAHKVVVLNHIPCFLVGTAPRGVHIVVRRAHIGRVCIWQPPFLRSLDDAIGRHLVEATSLQSRYTLGEDERLAWEILWHILHPLMVIVEADDIDGATLEEVVLRVWLVTTCGNRATAPRIILLYYLSKMLGEQRVNAQLIAICQG